MNRSVFMLLTWVVQTTANADDLIEILPPTPVANGSMTAFRKSGERPRDVLIHFHGAATTVKAAFARSNLNAVVVVINFPGLSTAYSTPFAQDTDLFQRVLQQTYSSIAGSIPETSEQWNRVSVSSFSAGYGAVREILKTPRYFEQIDAIVAADSIYAGLRQETPSREVDTANMQDFLRFATLAADGHKTFIVSHSAQPTPYASTTETAGYLLSALHLPRTADTSISTEQLHQQTKAQRGQFLVLGFEGTSGSKHLLHLYNIDLFWKQLPHQSRKGR